MNNINKLLLLKLFVLKAHLDSKNPEYVCFIHFHFYYFYTTLLLMYMNVQAIYKDTY